MDEQIKVTSVKKKYAYVFGAGASANSLPTLDGISTRVDSLLDTIRVSNTLFNQALSGTKKTKAFSQKEVFDLLRFRLNQISIGLKSSNHATFDTWMKKLLLQGDKPDYYNLIGTFTVLFAFEQMTNDVDPRYETFFSHLIDELDEFPNNLILLNWNYDNQLEMAYSKFNKKSISECADVLNISDLSNFKMDQCFQILKLNGSFNIHKYLNSFNDSKHDRHKLSSILQRLYELSSEIFDEKLMYNTGIRFAWDSKENVGEEVSNSLVSITELVVIGYTFPTFNKTIDQKLLQMMPNLRYVHIQDPNPEEISRRLSSRLSRGRENKIQFSFTPIDVNSPNDCKKEFYIPTNL